jgi:GNAT superfamily N-acetyltransferase/L-amino acid N-acyltransferase YncA
MSFEVRAIREDEREECIALWRTVWRGDNSDAYFRRYFYGDVEWLPYYTQVGVLDGKLVSAVQICKRIVACGEYRLTMGGIANVATLPEARGRGFNTHCLESAIRVMEADAMDFALLFTGINDYYARQGFSTLPRPWLSGSIREGFAPHHSNFRVRAVQDEDLESIYRVYDSYNRLRPITVQRTPAYWRDWIGIRPGNLPPELLVAVDRAGNLCGYAKSGTFRSAVPYSADAAGIRINELAIDRDERIDAEAEITSALLDAVAERSLAEGSKVLRLDLYNEPAIREALARIIIDPQEHINQSGMVRLLHGENLLRGFTMVWNDRWIEAGRPHGHLRFATPYGSVVFDCSGTFVRVSAAETAAEAWPQETLFGLMFGIVSAEQLTDDAELLALLNALFPRQAATYYGSDGF